MTLLVSLDGVRLRRGRRILAQPLTFSLAPGEGILVTGGNGSGKTTLCEIMAGLIRPKGGKIWRCKGLRAAYFPQGPVLFSTLTIMEHLLLCATRGASDLLGRLEATEEEVAAARLGMAARLEGLEQEPAAGLSIGERQLLKISMARTLKRELLVFDEPLAGVEAQSRNWASETLSRLKAEGKALLITTHEREHFKAVDFEYEIQLYESSLANRS